MIWLDAFLKNDNLVGKLICITVFCSHGIECVILIFNVPVTSDGVTINELEESLLCNPVQHVTFLYFSIIVLELL